MPIYQKVPDGKRFHPSYGRIMEHHGYATRIFWNKDMLDYLKRHFATTLNEELAGCLGVSMRTMIRKARELGLEKDRDWLHTIWEERRNVAQAVNKKNGNPNSFKKGILHNPDGEFKKGHTESEETKKKRIEGMKRWCRLHPDKVKERSRKIWETSRKNIVNNEQKTTNHQ